VPISPLKRSALSICVAAVATAALIAPTAAFASDSGSASDCANQVVSKPFLPWLDGADYTLPDGATFEGGADGWTLNGAGTVAGNESFYVHDAADSSSLRLPPGSSAASSPFCIGLGHPTLRFFAKQSGGGLLSLSALRVDVRFSLLGGAIQSLPVGLITAGGKWQPTLPVPVVVNLLTLLPDLRTVRFAFTPVGNATWQIDDVYVDPSARR
jgi:hypothetical protein